MPLSIILVRPEIPQNVGFVARAMKCYHLDSLTIVGRPRYRANSYAYKTGYTATPILQAAKHCATLEEALQGVHTAVGFSRRNRDKASERTWDLIETVPTMDFSQNVAFVFGQESQGLFKEDCALMSRLIKIELPNGDMSLNLAHAVTIALHEVFSHGLITHNPFLITKPARGKLKKSDSQEKEPSLFASREDTFSMLLNLLDKADYFKREKDKAKLGHLRNLWQRANPDEKELRFIMGMLKKLKG